MVLNHIISKIKGAKSIAILPHVSADGDALGSSLALLLALKKLNKDAAVYLEEEIPFIYSFLPGKQHAEVYSGRAKEFDLVIALDTGDMERLGERSRIFREALITVNLDHHNTNTEFAFYNHVQTRASAVGEIVYQLIKMLGVSLDADIATCLYVAVATDTGGFRYGNTTAVTHQIAGDLVNNGVNVSDINQKIFESVSLQKVKLMGMAINSMELFENNKIAFITLTDEMVRKAGAKEEDCDGIVNLGRNIYSVEVAAMLRMKGTDLIKVNLRSKNYVDVSAIAGMYSGGGHKRAAGCIVTGKIEDLKEKLLEDIKEALKNSVIRG
ncbi:MAG: bifunctional oligoribonuclease/PAP phosphatase NrnA [Clostridiales bacterium]|jgi:phosphoesterase RecJ-like protein|nr:bifunctional oligoribonuclease/PAP phosphatase NrnA [Eubacteriales bacterium]MDH7564911.1 bifunctional oligoribonuclease/PAP phosphatase NrnA [Clostridiales bacterium]